MSQNADIRPWPTPTKPDTIFVELFRALFDQLQSEGKDLSALADTYLAATLEEYDALAEGDQGQLNAIKSNLLNELSGETMTVKVFFKGLAVLGVESVGFNVTTAGPEGKGAAAHAAITLR